MSWLYFWSFSNMLCSHHTSNRQGVLPCLFACGLRLPLSSVYNIYTIGELGGLCVPELLWDLCVGHWFIGHAIPDAAEMQTEGLFIWPHSVKFAVLLIMQWGCTEIGSPSLGASYKSKADFSPVSWPLPSVIKPIVEIPTRKKPVTELEPNLTMFSAS